MAGLAKELTRVFSAFGRGIIRSNILSTSYSTIGIGGGAAGQGFNRNQNTLFSAFTSNRLLTQWYQKLDELQGYEQSEISNIALEVLSTYITNYISDSDELITLPDDVTDHTKYTERINKAFSQLGVKSVVSDHADEIIYYGAYSFKVDWDKVNRKWKRYELQNPYSVVKVRRGEELMNNLVVTMNRSVVQTAPNSIFTISTNSLHLINDLSENLFEDSKVKSDLPEGTKDTIVKNFDLLGGYPLYYNIVGKIKEYILKDQLISLLSIKDLIQPLLLLIRTDKNTDPTEANRLAVNTENLINKYSDLSAIFGANFSVMDLMDSVLNNIRVLPDYQSAIGDMNSVDLTKISNKIQDIKSDLDNSKENIYTTLGIPRSLFSGDTTKWEALKSSQRLNNKISKYIKGINKSISEMAATLYYLYTKEWIDPNKIQVHLFNKTDVDYSNAINSADIVSQLMDSINRVLDSVQRFVQDSKLVDPEEYLKYAISQVALIDPAIMDIIPPTKIKEFVKNLNSEESGGGFGGGRFGRYSQAEVDTALKVFSEAYARLYNKGKEGE